MRDKMFNRIARRVIERDGRYPVQSRQWLEVILVPPAASWQWVATAQTSDGSNVYWTVVLVDTWWANMALTGLAKVLRYRPVIR